MADKTYCYPDTNILKNKLNIHDENKLLEAEIRLVSIRLYQLQVQPVPAALTLITSAAFIIMYSKMFMTGQENREA